MKKIIISLGIIVAIGAIAAGVTFAFFNDTEISTGNTFTAGTIDIDIDGKNPFSDNFNIGDLKPGEVGYINFQINNVGKNPVNVSKKLYNFAHVDSGEGYDCKGVDTSSTLFASSEPECVAEAGTRVDDVQTQILYDLSVEVYDGTGKIWWQTIYEVDGSGNDNSLTDVYGNSSTAAEATPVALGMIPVGGHMLVTQSYHFNEAAGNAYQGDGLTFDMEIKGEQLTGTGGKATVLLENKIYDSATDSWVIDGTDVYAGTLEYETNASEFVYNFVGQALLTNHDYVLAIGMAPNGAGFDVDTEIATGRTDNSGNLTLTGSTEIGKDMMGVKVWLVPTENWTSGAMDWAGWDGCVPNFLWETGLVWYNDTDTP